MPGFVIFVFVLTFAYVVYFSVMITLDLHSKKDEKKTDEETIDVSSMDNEEVPVSVEEHNDGPEGSDMTYTEQVTDDGLRVVIPTGNKKQLIDFTVYRLHSFSLFFFCCVCR